MEDSRHLLQMLVIALLSTANGQHCDICPRCESSATNSTAICRCDQVCHTFNDCCCESSSSSDGTTTNFKCQSTYIHPSIPVLAENEAFLMISSCPGSWLDSENSTIESNCTQPSPHLPPVTDTSTGLVYRNEYCALCHQVTTFSLWESKLLCNDVIYHLNEYGNLWSTLRYDPAILQRHCAVCSFAPPPASRNEGTMYSLRSCIPYNDTCPPQNRLKTSTSTYNDLVQTCTRGSKNLVLSNGIVYHNEACVQCNGLRSTECFQLSTSAGSRLCPVPPGEVRSLLKFTITLSNLGGTDAKVSTMTNEIKLSFNCSDGEVLVGLDCRPLHCPSGNSNVKGKCTFKSIHVLKNFQIHNATLSNCSSPLILDNATSYFDLHNDTVVLSDIGLTVEVLDYDELGRPIICLDNNDTSYLNCNSTFVKLNRDDYEDLLNGSILFQNRVLDVMFNDSEDSLPLVCYDLIRPTTRLLFVEDLPGVQELTYIGCSLSVLGTVAIIFTYSIFKELHTLPGLVLINVCIPLFFTSLIFLIGGPVLQTFFLKELCSTVAIVLHYFYLSQFSWMTILSLEITTKFYQANRMMQQYSKKRKKTLLAYLVIGWTLPLSVLFVSLVLNFQTRYVQYGVDSQEETSGPCWINHATSLIGFFVVPLTLCLSFNFILFLVTTTLVCKAYKQKTKYGITGNKALLLRVWIALFTVTGCTWIFGFLALFKQISWMWYLFVIFNSTHGFSIFLSFTCTRRVFTLYRNALRKSRAAESSTGSKPTMSTQQTIEELAVHNPLTQCTCPTTCDTTL